MGVTNYLPDAMQVQLLVDGDFADGEGLGCGDGIAELWAIKIGFVESCGGRTRRRAKWCGRMVVSLAAVGWAVSMVTAAVVGERGRGEGELARLWGGYLQMQNAPFFVAKLAIKLLPCVILFRNGIGTDRVVGFQELGGKDDFTTKTLEALLIRKGIINGIKGDGEDEDDDYRENKRRTVRSSVEINSDSD
ncbi:thioredoxin domain PLP3B-like protein [Actinidia rufa]|uniref:Thioredoxin domain PLP3B-like protein n=1 Tax=Actinidia rufa TaxID=165716 RepID=A0A7J0HE08_9ERIC|nr:thioredoxin domain PLP3B-like protein [Actinidia rufa]